MSLSWPKLAISVLITEGSGGIGSLFTYRAIPTWYASLVKSPITPPNWIFAPMWISLFLLMGIALYLLWNSPVSLKAKTLPFWLFGIQLFLNVLWSVLFFGLHQVLYGAIEIVFLWFFILASIIEFRSISKVSSYLLFPYISWVTVATLLNMTILWVNV